MRIHDMIDTLCKPSGISFLSFLQPLLFWGDKPMTKSEREWRDSGFSSGDPKIFISFMEEFKKPRPYMVNFTSTFNQSSQQL